MCLFGAISSPPSIASDLSADGGFMYANSFGYLYLAMTYFQQGEYLVSLCLGKLCVYVHECSFDLVVGEALILPQLTSLTLSKLHLRVEFKNQKLHKKHKYVYAIVIVRILIGFGGQMVSVDKSKLPKKDNAKAEVKKTVVKKVELPKKSAPKIVKRTGAAKPSTAGADDAIGNDHILHHARAGALEGDAVVVRVADQPGDHHVGKHLEPHLFSLFLPLEPPSRVHRGDHVLHEHQQPVGDDCRRFI